MVLELQRVLSEYKAQGRDASAVPVFDDAAFRLGRYSDGALLRFRGIVRDVFDPELVLLSDGAADRDGGARALAQDLTSENFVERVPLKVALVPYVNDWAAQRYHPQTSPRQSGGGAPGGSASNAASKGMKRSNDAMASGEGEKQSSGIVTDAETDSVKKAKAASGEAKSETDADLPAFSEAVVTIYVYDGQYEGMGVDAFRVNESFEFTGVLDLMVLSSGNGAVSYDDGLSAQSIAELTISDCLEGMQRKQQSSVVLHCCDALKLDTLQYVLPHKPPAEYTALLTNETRRGLLKSQLHAVAGSSSPSLSDIRAALVEHLACAIGGDLLAAEYMLLCLVSRVTSRPDNATVLGNLSVNLSFEKNVHKSTMASSVASIYRALQCVVPMLAPVDMSIKSLNETKFLPHKDYENDMLRGGILQFAHGTTVLVNETVLSAGNLNDQGVKNVGALQSLVEKMLLPYDFQFYSMDFPQDVAVVSISQGKSILPVHVSAPVRLDADGGGSGGNDVAESMIDCFRLYIAVVRSMDVALGNEQAEIAEKHYVACRKAKQEVSIEDLHRWLRIARLVALSHGEDAVTTASWQQMLELEDKRITRLDEQTVAT